MLDTKTALSIIKKNLPFKRSELCEEAWQTLKAHCTQLTTHNSRYVTAKSIYKEFSNSIYGATPSGFRLWLEEQLNAEKDPH